MEPKITIWNGTWKPLPKELLHTVGCVSGACLRLQDAEHSSFQINFYKDLDGAVKLYVWEDSDDWGAGPDTIMFKIDLTENRTLRQLAGESKL